MRHSVLTSVAAVGILAALTGCSPSASTGPEPLATFTDNVLSTESVDIEILDVELTDGSVAVIDYEVTNTSDWETMVGESWLTHIGVSQAHPSTGTQNLQPEGYEPGSEADKQATTIVAPGETAPGTIAYRVVDPAVDLVVTTFDDEYVYVGEKSFDLS